MEKFDKGVIPFPVKFVQFDRKLKYSRSTENCPTFSWKWAHLDDENP